MENQCILYTALNFPSLIFALIGSEVLNSPSIQFYYLILYKYLYSPSFKFTLESEGEKGENKTGAKISLYTVVDSYVE